MDIVAGSSVGVRRWRGAAHASAHRLMVKPAAGDLTMRP
jgi:hypothetical protein